MINVKRFINSEDFSSGKGGEGINLIMFLQNLSYSEACFKAINDYNTSKDKNNNSEIIDVPKYKNKIL
jgi:hypothetical protein